jgi:hypothetical protein
LQVFASNHELFFINVELMQLLMEGHTRNDFFRAARLREIEELRRRRDWLNDSRIAAKFSDNRR